MILKGLIKLKKFFYFVLFIFIFQCSVVSAFGDTVIVNPDNKEPLPDDELSFVKNASHFAFYSTDDYIDIVNNELAMVAVSRVKDYKKCLDRLSRLVDSVKDTDAKYCASFAESILIERLAALEAYVNFAKCYSAKDVDGCKAFNSQMKYRGERAAKLRQDFYEVYGF